MELTLFLAQIWGPVMVAVGLGFFISPKYYVRIYRELEKDALAVLTFGMVAMAAGIAQILNHNVWETFNQGLISFLGWGLLAKGAAFVIAPGLVDRSGDWWAKTKFIPIAGAATLIIGAYVTWFAYFI